MLGPPKARHVDRSVLVSLETLVPAGHFYRHLDAALDLSFVRAWVGECYAATGRPSLDPVVFFKLHLLMFIERIPSERRLLETASLHLAHRWYLGYALDEPLPDHSTLSKIRARLGLPIFRRFFEHVVELCDRAGLEWGKELHFDGTKVRANGSVDSLVPRLRDVAHEHVDELFAPDARSGGGADPDRAAGEPAPAPAIEGGETVVPFPAAPSAPTHRGDDVAPDAGRFPPRWDLWERCRLDPARPAAKGYERQSDRVVSRTDPDATPMRPSGERACLGYHDHYCVDGGRARIILYPLVTPSDVMDDEPMLPMPWRAVFRWQLRPERAVADTRYGTIANIRALEDAGIRAYVPPPDVEARSPYLGASRFTFDAERDAYRCPRGELLPRHTAKYSEEVVVYRADGAACNACPLKAACTDSDHGRTIQRSFHHAYLERVRGYHGTADHTKAMRKRKRPEGTRPSRCSARPSNGTECAASGSAASRRSTRRRCWSRPARTSSACSPRRAGGADTAPPGSSAPPPLAPRSSTCNGRTWRPRLAPMPAPVRSLSPTGASPRVRLRPGLFHQAGALDEGQRGKADQRRHNPTPSCTYREFTSDHIGPPAGVSASEWAAPCAP